ncbi:DUF3106 domain-containing protein [Ralstonia solanacearum]|uniref:DUF3106 domain-containing protein n=1 Tax=Ralstonia solanacearum TaxID=305 RepID=UPI0001D958AB|nr:DUF3106 domain-containing protein [Ralstonia solanacearum]AST32575.2 DUF3106 domain-containing protein [Ralstonia solanacearum]AYB51190.1 DUF3106 domain-containing protein [Ralstonia solanacearum]AYB55741.1 DUF3106 domain-containing protein [Ralstonia solanacearum]MDB0507510.1 DUF3106 domain-containing protein [Ralstonia solanacearum]MDB0512829.1 DUF3106 domain-containing protein [Ralstonia solanacearum]
MSHFQRTPGQPPRGDRSLYRRLAGAAFACAAGLVACVAAAQVPPASAPAAMAPAAPAGAPAAAPAAPATNPQPSVHPNWSELGILQQRILAPLAPEWNGMPELARKKWLQIAQAYQKYTPAQQQRLQTRMADWVKLTPEQRHRARENYQTSKSLPVQKKSEAWQNYQQLPEEQKKALAAAAKAQKPPSAVTALPGSTSLAKDAAKAIHRGARPRPGTTRSAPNPLAPTKPTATASAPVAVPAPAPAAASAPASSPAPAVTPHPAAPSANPGGEMGTPPPSTVLGG